jgi:hypothetical protein
MQNPGFLNVSRQSHLGVNATGSERWMDYMLIVRGQNYDRLLIEFAHADLAVAFVQARD